MKIFLQNKRAFTLAELLISVWIISFIVVWSVFFLRNIFWEYDLSKKENIFLVSNLQDSLNEAKTQGYFVKDCSSRIILENPKKNNNFIVSFSEEKIFFWYSSWQILSSKNDNFQVKNFESKELEIARDKGKKTCKISIYFQKNEKYTLYL